MTQITKCRAAAQATTLRIPMLLLPHNAFPFQLVSRSLLLVQLPVSPLLSLSVLLASTVLRALPPCSVVRLVLIVRKVAPLPSSVKLANIARELTTSPQMETALLATIA